MILVCSPSSWVRELVSAVSAVPVCLSVYLAVCLCLVIESVWQVNLIMSLNRYTQASWFLPQHWPQIPLNLCRKPSQSLPQTPPPPPLFVSIRGRSVSFCLCGDLIIHGRNHGCEIQQPRTELFLWRARSHNLSMVAQQSSPPSATPTLALWRDRTRFTVDSLRLLGVQPRFPVFG